MANMTNIIMLFDYESSVNVVNSSMTPLLEVFSLIDEICTLVLSFSGLSLWFVMLDWNSMVHSFI